MNIIIVWNWSIEFCTDLC